MMKLFLLRHGQTNLNRDGKYQGAADKDLNDFGRNQAILLGKRLKKYNIDIIYSSDLKRVLETSEIINNNINKEIIVKEELREINMGSWDTLTIEERYMRHGDYAKEWSKHLEDLPYPDGECGRDVCKRAMKVVNQIKNQLHENIAIVTSGGTIAILLSEFLGLEQYKRFNMLIDNCSISLVEYDKPTDKFIVKCVNDTGHLESLIAP